MSNRLGGQAEKRFHLLIPVYFTCPAAGEVGGFAQDAEIVVAAGSFRGVGEGVVLAVGERLHAISDKARLMDGEE